MLAAESHTRWIIASLRSNAIIVLYPDCDICVLAISGVCGLLSFLKRMTLVAFRWEVCTSGTIRLVLWKNPILSETLRSKILTQGMLTFPEPRQDPPRPHGRLWRSTNSTFRIAPPAHCRASI